MPKRESFWSLKKLLKIINKYNKKITGPNTNNCDDKKSITLA